MNGVPPVSAAQSLWDQHVGADGKAYYSHKESRATTWLKPIPFMNRDEAEAARSTLPERALIGTPWQKHMAGDRPYWAHNETRETTWQLPDVVDKNLKELERQIAERPATLPFPQYVAGAESFMPQYDQKFSGRGRDRDRDRDEYQHPDRRDREREDRFGGGDRPNIAFNAQSELRYPTSADAEAAFAKLMKRLGVASDWTWPQVVRIGAKDPEWRAIPDPVERELAFKRYCDDIRTQEKEREVERQAKVRTDFMDMLRSHPEIRYFTRWRTALPFIKDESIFKTAKDDNERRMLFEDYIITLQKDQQAKEAKERETALKELRNLLDTLEIEAFTRWSTAYGKLRASPQFDATKFGSLKRADLLKQFEYHVQGLQEVRNAAMQKRKRATNRRERQNRDAFRSLLDELKDAGVLIAGCKWKDIHDLIKDDKRYRNMLGQNGSHPLDIFWDVRIEMESEVRSLRYKALDVLEKARFEVKTTTEFEEFDQVMRSDHPLASIKEHTMRGLFNYTLDKVRDRDEKERHKAEHKEREAIDDLRQVFKTLEPPVSVTDTWEKVKPRVEKFDQFKAMKESTRVLAFEKHVRRLKERDYSERRDRRRDTRDRDSGRDRRDRDREYRNGHSDSHRRPRTRTRSPEQDAYEAERKKAQLDREARYRHDGSTGLSPPYRRDRDDRYDGSRRGSDHYVRERREREVERERVYVSRADPRDRVVNALDYGDDRGLPSRRRRESDDDGSSRRDVKRPRYSPHSPRRDRRSRTRTPAVKTPDPVVKEDPGLRSGSEEGEIEED